MGRGECRHQGESVPSSTQATILAAFNQASTSTGSGANIGGIAEGLLPASNQGLIDALSLSTQIINAQTQATSANTVALGQNAEAKSSSGVGSTVSSVLNTAGDLLGGGLSLLPVVSLLSGLFGGKSPDEPAPLAPFSLPPALNMESTTNYQNVVWGETGMPTASGNAPASVQPQITVQVQAMDSQSFLDHSDDIAQAVRHAMLNMNAINDMVTNL